MITEADACLFCSIPSERIVASNDLAYAIRDGFPVTPLHTLIIPKRHLVDYFSLTEQELLACNALVVGAGGSYYAQNREQCSTGRM